MPPKKSHTANRSAATARVAIAPMTPPTTGETWCLPLVDVLGAYSSDPPPVPFSLASGRHPRVLELPHLLHHLASESREYGRSFEVKSDMLIDSTDEPKSG